MKRACRLFVACALLFAALPISAEEPAPEAKSDTVKAEHGLSYVKPAGWFASSGKRGAVSTLRRAGDDKNQIEFRFAPVLDKQAESFFTTFHSSLAKARLERVSADGKSFGPHDGRITEYKLGSETPRSVIVFELVTPNGAWLIIGLFESRSKDSLWGMFETLIGGVKFD